MARRTMLALGVLVGAGAFAVIGGIAWAAIPGPGGVIQGCYANGGNLKVVEGLPCPKGHTPLQWNQTGAPGVSGHEIVTDTEFFDDTVLGICCEVKTATCSQGKKVLGGGGSIIFGPGADPFFEGHPMAGGVAEQSFPVGDTGWRVVFEVDNNLEEPFTISAYAICAAVS